MDAPSQDLQSEEGDEQTSSQAIDILAGLSSLGISPELRSKVHAALSELAQHTGEHAPLPDDSGVGSVHGTSQRGTSQASTSGRKQPADVAQLAEQLKAAEQQMNMSRSIMRKLYYKNVGLEKELLILKANQGCVSSSIPDTPGSPYWQSAVTPSGADGMVGRPMATPIAQALRDKDLAIAQLRQALDAARRRCALLEACQGSQGSTATGSSGKGEAGRASGPNGRAAGIGSSSSMVHGGMDQDALRTLLAQSSLHHSKYRQIREDYNRLLNKRASTLQTSAKTSATARELVGNMQARLVAEVAEREAEAALYSARLYESERAASDWFVEKRLLEDHIAKLSAEVTSRDALDAEIQTCVAGLFERTRALEFENDVLRAELVRLGVSPDALFRQHSLSALGPLDSGSLQDSTRQGSGRGMHAGGGVIHKADVLIVE